ncbi:hypothetical protein LOTGIDRAFT_232463 [Lottia gigantea]|uniref:TOG domain-containing protein n=1 Tax=Lottia gigantea TaxID=225164 RepID=V4AKU4_LOTGI|nr:hypothetical protein LOTGIDRAFT_232463 [Lottia gigantea]ESO94206.1 hypothetical protein LOTGIDRAFT_232463 [Lottia gigantea]
MADKVLLLLCSSAKIERDRGCVELEKFLEDKNEEEVKDFEDKLLKILSDASSSWESKHGGLMGSKSILLHKHCSGSFPDKIRQHSIGLLEDEEFRVRIAAGEVLGVLCKKIGSVVYSETKDKILEGIRTNLERQIFEDDSTDDSTAKLAGKLAPESSNESPASNGTRQRRDSKDAAQIFHDTAGWKSLETWMKCLQNVINGCGYSFNKFVDQELLDLIFSSLTHTNRFVRETGYYVCSSLVACGFNDQVKADEGINKLEENAIYQHGEQFAEYLGKGLSDNWSQVRLAGSVATRKFLSSLPSDEIREKYYPDLLPRMCLNRYYVAEGVRIYSQDTWKTITHGEGRNLVERHIGAVVDYYIKQSDADNHAVREAACACIAELGLKAKKEVVSPYISQLLDALIICFNDDSWPVRDAACVACGNFIKCFPDESRSCMPALYPLFFTNLQDSISSVRQGAALALTNVFKAYGENSQEMILSKIKEGLDGVEKQPSVSEKYSDLEKGPATYGVVKKLRDNDMELHTDKQMYSCGSLAPKMGRGSSNKSGGCMDHKFRKPSEPWELADGCIYIVLELSRIQTVHQPLCKLLTNLVKAVSYHHYPQHVVLLETLCKQLPGIARGLGKRLFKMYIEMFLDSIFYSLKCDNILTSNAAIQCLLELNELIGPAIFRGRIEQYDSRYLQELNRVVPPAAPM